jgi:hypothetical protein
LLLILSGKAREAVLPRTYFENLLSIPYELSMRLDLFLQEEIPIYLIYLIGPTIKAECRIHR